MAFTLTSAICGVIKFIQPCKNMLNAGWLHITPVLSQLYFHLPPLSLSIMTKTHQKGNWASLPQSTGFFVSPHVKVFLAKTFLCLMVRPSTCMVLSLPLECQFEYVNKWIGVGQSIYSHLPFFGWTVVPRFKTLSGYICRVAPSSGSWCFHFVHVGLTNKQFAQPVLSFYSMAVGH